MLVRNGTFRLNMYFLGVIFFCGLHYLEAHANVSTEVVDVRKWIGHWKKSCAADLISSMTVPNVKACETYLKSCANCCVAGFHPLTRECHLLTASPMEVIRKPGSQGIDRCSATCGAYTPIAAVSEWAQCPFRNETANGAIIVDGGVTSQQTAYYTCDEGYILIGSSNITCPSNGSWSETPWCQVVDCGPLTVPTNGRQRGYYTTYQQVIQAYCDVGFFLRNGTDRRTCQADGNWTDTMITCEPCGGVLNATSDFQNITSARYPAPYTNDTDCFWRIQGLPGTNVYIELTYFSLEKKYDYIKIYDGPTDQNFTFGNYSGEIIPQPLQTTGSEAFVHFFTDFSIGRGGFVMQFKSVCGGTYSSTWVAQNLSSPSYPNSYPENHTCLWNISAPLDVTIQLEFSSLSLQTNLDSLVFIDGLTVNDPSMRTYTGPGIIAATQTLITTGSHMLVEFSAGPSTQGTTGFQLRFWNVCAQGFIPFGGKCLNIRILVVPETWPDGLAYCSTLNATLLTMQDFTLSDLQALSMISCTIFPIGGRVDQNDASGLTWRWLDGTLIDTTAPYFYQNEPTALNGEGCLITYHGQNMQYLAIHDAPCNWRTHLCYVCQKL